MGICPERADEFVRTPSRVARMPPAILALIRITAGIIARHGDPLWPVAKRLRCTGIDERDGMKKYFGFQIVIYKIIFFDTTIEHLLPDDQKLSVLFSRE
ncbi:hypothetical protein P3T23_001464 [Paraburkholderia sp. GAS448]|uniref:hypothetical protein n=1 Tax=Paraburkholderia sp. GAS448 TaxID=3035136 RepID=UPI003D23168A